MNLFTDRAVLAIYRILREAPLLQLNADGVSGRLANILDRVDRGLAPESGALLLFHHSFLAVLRNDLIGAVGQSDHNAVTVAVHRLHNTDRNLVVDDTYEPILKNEFLRSSAYLQGIKRFLVGPRKRQKCGSEADSG